MIKLFQGVGDVGKHVLMRFALELSTFAPTRNMALKQASLRNVRVHDSVAVVQEWHCEWIAFHVRVMMP